MTDNILLQNRINFSKFYTWDAKYPVSMVSEELMLEWETSQDSFGRRNDD